MSDEEVFDEVLRHLEEHRIEYMVTGSHASNLYSVGRSTIDGDVVIRTLELPLRQFMQDLQGRYYADVDMALDALRTNFMFNVIHLQSGYKVDLIVLKTTPFEQMAFERRSKGKFLEQERWFLTAEDSILSKLAWQHAGGSARQLEDAIAVAKGQWSTLDIPYLQTWAKELSVSDVLEEMLQSIKEQL
ncbi:MAG: hypothetical protein ABI623_05170 [bacterium]